MYKISTSSTLSNLGTYSISENEKESRSSSDVLGNGNTPQSFNPGTPGKVPAFGGDNFLLSPLGNKDSIKRRKPKSSLMKSSSTYLSRVIANEGLSKRLQEHDPEGLFVFANINRAFNWLDLSASTTSKADHLVKILFSKAHMLCHDTNQVTKSSGHLDVIMGSSTGDMIWFEAYTQKYFRINKNGIINPTAVTDIHWLPGSETLFLAAHVDGTLIVYDKEREDAAFVPEENSFRIGEANENESEHRPLHVNKSVNSRNQKANPVAAWRISNSRINGFSFSPDSCHLAVVSEDGSLRIINYLKEHYYGGFTCVCWSPDGKYILTGGQDDLVSIWSLNERRIVARCPGHHSWVSCVAFDPWRCGDRNYRFGSVGEDRRLLLWDFSVGMLHKPKTSKIVDEDHPMSWIGFDEDSIIAACADGHVRIWNRPQDGVNSSQLDLTLPG
ncbi:MAG: hypothetical protein Q9191_003797 [Dirinaria sp. TL-2023a]